MRGNHHHHRSLAVLLVLCLLLLRGAQGQGCTVSGNLLNLFYYTRYGVPQANDNPVPGATITTIRSPTVDYDWAGGAPNSLVPADFFYGIWVGQFTPPVTGVYYLTARTDDGFWLYVSNLTTISYPNPRSVGDSRTSALNLVAGVWYDIRLEMYERGGLAVSKLLWKSDTPAAGISSDTIIPSSAFRYTGCGVNITYSIGLVDTVGSGNFQVVLTSPPSANVVVSFTSALPLSVCNVTFTPSNWSIAVNVTVYSDGSAFGTGVTRIPVVATATSTDTTFNNATGTGYVVRTNAPGASATTWGDPHFTTFDGTKHNLYQIGDYYFVRQLNSEFVVQTRQNKCATVSCNYGVAFKFRTSVFYVFLSTAGVPSTLVNEDVSKNGITITSSNNQFTFSTETGITARAAVSYWSGGNVWYLNIDVTIPSTLRGQVRGLAGDFDGSTSNDFVLVNGATTTTESTFQAAWKISTQSENLFFNAAATIPTLAAVSGSTVVTASTTYTARPYCGTVPTTTGTVITNTLVTAATNFTIPAALNNVTFDPNFTPSTTVTNTQLQTIANKTCTSYFLTGTLAIACNALGVNGQRYYDNCYLDYLIAGDASFVIDAVNAYYSECTKAGVTNGTVPGGTNSTQLTCPNFCNGQGNCTNGTCTCFAGFTGSDCGTSTTVTPNVTTITPVYSNVCVQLLTISGRNFNSSMVIVCQFGTVNVTATFVSQWQLTCTWPVVTGLVNVRVLFNGVVLGSLNGLSIPSCCPLPSPDSDGDTFINCNDTCPFDALKWNSVGTCGCGVKDIYYIGNEASCGQNSAQSQCCSTDGFLGGTANYVAQNSKTSFVFENFLTLNYWCFSQGAFQRCALASGAVPTVGQVLPSLEFNSGTSCSTSCTGGITLNDTVSRSGSWTSGTNFFSATYTTGTTVSATSTFTISTAGVYFLSVVNLNIQVGSVISVVNYTVTQNGQTLGVVRYRPVNAAGTSYLGSFTLTAGTVTVTLNPTTESAASSTILSSTLQLTNFNPTCDVSTTTIASSFTEPVYVPAGATLVYEAVTTASCDPNILAGTEVTPNSTFFTARDNYVGNSKVRVSSPSSGGRTFVFVTSTTASCSVTIKKSFVVGMVVREVLPQENLLVAVAQFDYFYRPSCPAGTFTASYEGLARPRGYGTATVDNRSFRQSTVVPTTQSASSPQFALPSIIVRQASDTSAIMDHGQEKAQNSLL